MPDIKILIGPFQRRVFAEGLARALRDEPDFVVSLTDDESQAAGLMNSATPVGRDQQPSAALDGSRFDSQRQGT